MSNNSYRFRFYLNAMHFININGGKSSIHPHTWEIVTYISRSDDNFVEFTNVEKEMDKYLSIYDGTLLNDFTPFDRVNPTMENMGKVIAKGMIEILNNNEWNLNVLEISENPTRSYILTKENFDDLEVEENIVPMEFPSAVEISKDIKLNEVEYMPCKTRSLLLKKKNREKKRKRRTKIKKILKWVIPILIIINVLLVGAYLRPDIFNFYIVNRFLKQILTFKFNQGGI